MAELMKYITWMLSPLGLWLVCIALAQCGLIRHQSVRQWIWGFGCAQLLFWSLPAVSDRILGVLEKQALALQQVHPLPSQPVDAIVVLGGGLEPAYDGIRSKPDLGDGADRMWVAADLYHRGIAPRVLASGGGFSPDSEKHTEAEGMSVLMQAFGVPSHALLQEGTSRTTFENALNTAQVLQRLAPHRNLETQPWKIALVTSGFHMIRAHALFSRAGFEVYPVVADVRVTFEGRPGWEWLPKSGSLDRSTLAIKEWLGRLQLHVLDWFKVSGQ